MTWWQLKLQRFKREICQAYICILSAFRAVTAQPYESCEKDEGPAPRLDRPKSAVRVMMVIFPCEGAGDVVQFRWDTQNTQTLNDSFLGVGQGLEMEERDNMARVHVHLI